MASPRRRGHHAPHAPLAATGSKTWTQPASPSAPSPGPRAGRSRPSATTSAPACCRCRPGPAGTTEVYGARHLARLSFVRRARSLGFSIGQINALLDLAEQRDRSCEAVDAIAREHLAEVERKLADLSALRRELASLIGRCRHGSVAECRALDALAPGHSKPLPIAPVRR